MSNLPPAKPPKPDPIDLEPSGSRGRLLAVIFFGAGVCALFYGGAIYSSPVRKPSTHGDVAANAIERGTSRVRYIGPADEDLGSCVCAPELGGEKASDGPTRTVCACTGRMFLNDSH